METIRMLGSVAATLGQVLLLTVLALVVVGSACASAVAASPLDHRWAGDLRVY